MPNPEVFCHEYEALKASLQAMIAGTEPTLGVKEISDRIQYYYDNDEMSESEYNELMGLVFNLNL